MSNVAAGDGGAGGGAGLAAFAGQGSHIRGDDGHINMASIPPIASVDLLPLAATNGNGGGQEEVLAQQLGRAELIFPKVNGKPMEGQAFSALLHGQQEAERRQGTPAAAHSYAAPLLPLSEGLTPLSTVDHCQDIFSLPMEVESAASPSAGNWADMMPHLLDDPILNAMFAPAPGQENHDEFSLFE